ncbi:MAG: hypothetical protein IT583_00170 [Verrucomicrobia bacterium]|nr:hypothetical protein [Verrucomicrobiota bacterium]
MSSSDIYEVKESPWAKKAEAAVSQQRSRRHRHGKSFDEAVNPDLAHTHRRRSRNSGVRRLQHRLKDPKFSKRFWLSTLGTAGLILVLLIVWDLFFRYPKAPEGQTPGIYRATVK